jgi:hypothetical protein
MPIECRGTTKRPYAMRRAALGVEVLEPRRCLAAVVEAGSAQADDVILAKPDASGGEFSSAVGLTAVMRRAGAGVRRIDLMPPRVVAVTAPARRPLGANAMLRISVRFNEAVRFAGGGAAELPVEVGGVTVAAPFIRAGGRRTLVFALTVSPGLEGRITSAGPLALNAGEALTDAAGNDAALDMPRGAQRTLGRVRIVGVDPEGVSVGDPLVARSGRAATIVAQMSEPVVVRGRPSIRALVGGTVRLFDYASGSGSDKLVFRLRSRAGLATAAIVTEPAIRVGGRDMLRDRAGNELVSLGTVRGFARVEGAPAPGRTVTLLDGLTMLPTATSTSFSDGEYIIRAVPAGMYVALVEGSLGAVATPLTVGPGASVTFDIERPVGDEGLDAGGIDSRPCCERSVGVYVVDPRGPVSGELRDEYAAIVADVRDGVDLPYRLVSRIDGHDEPRRVDYCLFVFPDPDLLTYRLVDVTTAVVVDAGWLDDVPLTQYLVEGVAGALGLDDQGAAPDPIAGADNFATLIGGAYHRHLPSVSSELLGATEGFGLLVWGGAAGRHGITFGDAFGAVVQRVTVVAEDYTASDGLPTPGTIVTFIGCDAAGERRTVEVGVWRPAAGNSGVTIDSADHGLVRVDGILLQSYEAVFRNLRFEGLEWCPA